MSVWFLASIRLHFVGSPSLHEQQARCGQKVHRFLRVLAPVLTACPKTMAVPAATLAMTRRRWVPVANAVVMRSKRCDSICCSPGVCHCVRKIRLMRPGVLYSQAYAGLMF